MYRPDRIEKTGQDIALNCNNNKKLTIGLIRLIIWVTYDILNIKIV